MRWSDERYVRLYTRDTTTWKLLPWQSRALLPLLLRKLDRAGMVDLGDDGFDGIAALTDLPIEFVTAAMPELLRRRVFVLAGSELIMPHFLEAQEAVASGKLRSEQHRERAKTRNESLRSAPERSETQRQETPSDAEQRHATPSRAEPSSAVPDPDQRNVGGASPTPIGVDVGVARPEGSPTYPTAPRPTASRPVALAPEGAANESSPPSAESRTRPLFDAALMPATSKKPTSASLAADVTERVYAVYLAARAASGRKGRTPGIKPKEKKLVSDRLAEGCTEDELCAAARGIWINDGRREEGHREFFHSMRDTNIAALGILDAKSKASSLGRVAGAPPPPPPARETRAPMPRSTTPMPHDVSESA